MSNRTSGFLGLGAMLAVVAALAGREISWDGGPDEGDRAGVAAGIDQRGNLLVRTAGGETVALGSGEVHLTLR